MMAGDYSFFASRDDTGGHLVTIALNFSRDRAVVADLDVASCGKLASMQSFTYEGDGHGFVRAGAVVPPRSEQVIPPYSIAVFDAQLGDAAPVVH